MLRPARRAATLPTLACSASVVIQVVAATIGYAHVAATSRACSTQNGHRRAVEDLRHAWDRAPLFVFALVARSMSLMAKSRSRSKTQPATPVRRPIRRLFRWQSAAILVAVAVYYAMAVHGVAHDSGTFDEYADVTAGYSYWTFNDYRLNAEAGNWSQRLLALPQVIAKEPFPSLAQPAWQNSYIWALSDQLFFAPGRDADTLLSRSRAVAAVFGALLGVLVFFWARHLFGIVGAWISLLLYVFSPTMLANGALATSDLMTAGFFTAAVWALWVVLHRLTPWTDRRERPIGGGDVSRQTIGTVALAYGAGDGRRTNGWQATVVSRMGNVVT